MATRFAPVLKSATRAATKVVKNAAKNALTETGKEMMTSYLKGQFTPSPTFIRTASPSFSSSSVTPIVYSSPFFSPPAISRPIQYPVPCVCTVSNNAPKVGEKSVFVCNYCGSPGKTPTNLATHLQDNLPLVYPESGSPSRNISNKFITDTKNDEPMNESFYGGRRTRKRLRRRKTSNRH